jgi:hypothetical protein
MGAHLHEHGISLFTVPKCACSSLKAFFFHQENGFAWREFSVDGKVQSIHMVGYRNRRFAEEKKRTRKGYWRIALVREPVARILSCWSNRVAHHKLIKPRMLSQEDRDLGMTTSPDLEQFVRHLDRYRRASKDIRFHSLPLSRFLGRKAGYYDRIYGFGEIGALADDVNARTGRDHPMPRLQSGGPKPGRADLSREAVDRIEALYAEDRELFGAHF